MKLNQIQYVYEIYSCGSMTLAAKKLFVTQPTLSQQITSLEEELNVKLFIRDGKKMLLTPAGEEFITFAKRILSDISNLQHIMDEYSALCRGRIRIGLYSTLPYRSTILNHIAQFHRKFPAIQFHIISEFSKTLLDMLLDHQLDIALVVSKPNLENALILPVLSQPQPMMALLSREHRLSRKNVIAFQDLQGEPVILPSPQSSLYMTYLNFFHEAGITPNVLCETSDPNLYLPLVRQGMGIGFAAPTIVGQDPSLPIVCVPLDREVFCATNLVCLKDSYHIAAIRHFVDYIKSTC